MIGRGGIAVLVALLALLPAAAHADDTYTVHYCNSPAGSAATTDGLTAISGDAGLGFACPGAGVSSGPPLHQFVQLQGYGIRYRVPADTRLMSYVLYRTAAVPAPWNWTLFNDADALTEATTVERCWSFTGCTGLGNGKIAAGSRVARTAPDTSGLQLWVDCNPGPCAPGGTRVTLHRLDAELADRLDPTLVGAPSGDLLVTQRAVAGTRSVAFSATDRGGGVYQATLEVDGRPAVTQVVDDNGGRCREPFTESVPCRLSASGSIALDTATLPDGVHALRLLVTDATGTNTVTYGPVEITTRNQSPGCDPSVMPAVTPVTARFRGSRRTHLTRRRGRGAHVRGSVAGAGAGTPVLLVAREVRNGAPSFVAARGLTAADGSYSLAIPAGPSRTIRVGYRVRPNDPQLACSRVLHLRTPARVTLHAAPHAVRAGARVRLSGRLLGGRLPRRGKLVELQAFERGRWRTFDTVRAAHKTHRYVTHYRFGGGSRGRSFRLRARVRPDSSYPFSTGHSAPVRVRVV